MKIELEKYEEFDVYKSNDCLEFIHINIKDGKTFYKKLFNYFFSENKLLRYIENNTKLKFTPTKDNYNILFKKLSIFIDKENEIEYPQNLDLKIKAIINEEYMIENTLDNKKIRLDKIGKIGEYIFNSILFDYFKLNCVIPKLNLITNRNMSVYGIDSIFYSIEKNYILFGESKVTNNLSNGISLINESLKNYKRQIDEEFILILSNRLVLNGNDIFSSIFKDYIDKSLSMADFINKANIKK